MPDGILKKYHDEIMRDEEIIDIVTEAALLGITKVRITGGEPLVKKGIYDLIKKIKSVKGINEITITTNGILLIDNVTLLKEAGVNRVNFSLDTLDSEKYKYITHSEQSLDYETLIKQLIEFELTPIKINTVLLKDINENEISKFIDLADKYDITIRFIELMPVGHLKFDHKTHYISKQDILKKHPELQLQSNENIAEYYHVDGKKGMIGFINPISEKFCDNCDRIRLTSDGHLLTCLHNNNEINVKNNTQVQLVKKLKEAILSKPKSHKLDESTENKSTRSMNKIGG